MEILAAVTTLVAVILGPLVSVFVSKHAAQTQITIAEKQIRAQTVSASRQAWIDALRNDVADYMALITRAATYTSDLVSMLPEIVMLQMRVQLRLNKRGEKLHADLAVRMAESVCGIQVGIPADDPEAIPQATKKFGDDIAEIQRLTSLIVKQEWDRIKKGD